MVNNNRAAIQIRREKIWTLLTEGMSSPKIAEYVKCDKATVSRDIKFMTEASHKFVNDLARETLPFIYQKGLEGMYNILNECWGRYRFEGNGFYLKLALDCHKEILSAAANGPSVLAVKKITERANSLGIGNV
jgi:hypothetical protein